MFSERGKRPLNAKWTLHGSSFGEALTQAYWCINPGVRNWKEHPGKLFHGEKSIMNLLRFRKTASQAKKRLVMGAQTRPTQERVPMSSLGNKRNEGLQGPRRCIDHLTRKKQKGINVYEWDEKLGWGWQVPGRSEDSSRRGEGANT
ncbi:hypothetical protein NDU88_007315 [Pleurodeles waltl]|uniref:Uncharacterized protein n=1 Tax=Pleurodeles waltl TaxID=8319 RepID=A0AAV7MFS9_PLEWA|nr:hypothetical protein NDU88_007315 [Pleurodeles waltl]